MGHRLSRGEPINRLAEPSEHKPCGMYCVKLTFQSGNCLLNWSSRCHFENSY